MRILAIGAHPDDIECLAGGTMALLAGAGHELTFAIATNGNVGTPTGTREEIAARRFDEAHKSAALVGASVIWMDFDDEWLFNDRSLRTAFIDAYRRARPEVVFALSPTDYHPDHSVAGQVAIDARIPAAVRLVETGLPALDQVPRLFVTDTVGGIDFIPDLYVDITSTMETRRDMLRAHSSQEEWNRAIYGANFTAVNEATARRRGSEVGVEYAECFREIKSYPPIESAFEIPCSIPAP